MSRYLAREGFEVVTAQRRQEGLRLARELRPAAITLDVMMPDLDGWTVLAAIKADPELADIPVVLLTIVDEKNRGYALGATDYMTKPVDRERLVGLCATSAAPSAAGCCSLTTTTSCAAACDSRSSTDGWQVAEAENGRAALDAARRDAPRHRSCSIS